jgi:ubiquinone/menaquinone biosynthesis C-methylase UbiE
MRPVSPSRWHEAQAHELDFWRAWRDLAPYRGVDLDAYWRGEIAKFGLTDTFFAGRRVLDVGCGPVGLIHFLPQAGERIRLDPLLHVYQEKLSLPGLSVTAAGEQLPLADRAVDIAICFNALDHMRDPAVALAELARVLRPGGTLLLMIHTFPAWTMPLLAIDRLHPHHWTHAAFLNCVRRQFRVVHEHRERRTFPMSFADRLKPSTWKYTAAGLVLATTYVVAENAV